MKPIRAKKRLGQHFLTDGRILQQIVDALGVTAEDTVIEIGPGQGALTDRLVERAGRVVMIELDRDLVPRLRERYADQPQVSIIEGDVLGVSLSVAASTAAAGGMNAVATNTGGLNAAPTLGPTGAYLVAGNVPYYITTPILFHVLVPPRPLRAVFLVQREVAERVVARPGDEAYGALSVNVQAVAHAELLHRVHPGAFVPPPTVESAVLRLVPSETPLVSAAEQPGFSAFVIAAFSARRKQMRRVLRTIREMSMDEASALLARAGIPSDARPEVVAPQQFVTLYRYFAPGYIQA